MLTVAIRSYGEKLQAARKEIKGYTLTGTGGEAWLSAQDLTLVCLIARRAFVDAITSPPTIDLSLTRSTKVAVTGRTHRCANNLRLRSFAKYKSKERTWHFYSLLFFHETLLFNAGRFATAPATSVPKLRKCASASYGLQKRRVWRRPL